MNFPKLRRVKRSTASCSAALLASFLVQVPGLAQTPPRQKIDLSKLGLQVGEREIHFQ